MPNLFAPYRALFCVFVFVLTGCGEPAPESQPGRGFDLETENVTFQSDAAAVTLAGTLSRPAGKSGRLPAAILLTGAGPQDRDETIFGHKPFKVIAEYLTAKGFVVLRFDDRGNGESTGAFQGATILDFADDARGALAYMQNRADIDPARTVFIGHSEGGLVAGIAAAGRSDLGGVVLLAAPGIPMDQLLLEQTEAIMTANGVSRDVIDRTLDLSREIYDLLKVADDRDRAFEQVRDKLVAFGLQPTQAVVNARLLTSDWFLTSLKTVPSDYYSRLQVPTLAMTGSKDLQVLPTSNLSAIRDALSEAGGEDVEIVEVEGVNHLFQTAETGHPNEYAQIEETIAPKVLDRLGQWMTTRLEP